MGVVPCPRHGCVWSRVDDDAPIPWDFAGFGDLPGSVGSVAWIVAVAVWGVPAANRCAVAGAEPIVRCVRAQVAPRCLGCAWSVAR